MQLFSWGCKYQHSKALSESDKLLIFLRALKINLRMGRICSIAKKTPVKPSVLGFSLSAGTSPVLAFAVSAEPACPEVIISASYSRGKTTFLFSFANKHLSPSGSSIMPQGEKCPWSSDLSNFSNYLYQECNIPSRQPNRYPMSLSIFLLRQLL